MVEATTSTGHVEDGLAEGLDVVRELAQLVESATSQEDYIRRLPGLLAAHFRSPLAGITYGLGSFAAQETFSDGAETGISWEGPLSAAILEAQRDNRAFARIYDGPAGTKIGLCALPVRIPGLGTGGAVGLLVSLPSKDLASATLSELRALVSLFEFGAPADPQDRANADTAPAGSMRQDLQGMSKAANYSTLFEFGFAITNNLRTKIDCEQVTLSQVVRTKVQIISISGIDDPKPRTPGIIELTQAQEECIDQKIPIFAQEIPDWDDGITTKYRLHTQWREAAGGANVGSIPLIVDDEIVAVISLRRAPTRPFTQEEIDACVERITPFARSIEMLRRGDRRLGEHVTETVRTEVATLYGPGRLMRKATVVLLATALLWFFLGSMTVRRPMVGHVAARQVVHLAAPFMGPIRQVMVEEGEFVVQGQALARLDTEDLALEQADLKAQRSSASIEIDQYLASGDLVQADLARARSRVIDAQLASVSRRIESAVIRAPENGVILRGDVKGRMLEVVPQGEPLFEFVAHGDLRLELDVPEAYVDELQHGSKVLFAANAAPEKARELTVDIVNRASEVRSGQNVFVSTADFVNDEDVDMSWLRVGMEGVAKVDVGERPIRTIAFERISQAIYQSVWL